MDMAIDSLRMTSDQLVHVSKRFLALSLLSCILVAFAVGRTARMLLFVNPHVRFLLQARQSFENPPDDDKVMKLPNPVLKNGKLPPPTLYTSKNFDTARSATIHSRWVVTEHGPGDTALPSTGKNSQQECMANDPKECSTCRGGKREDGSQDEDEEVHLPVGQHLLMDIRNVDSSFLASEERLAQAMLDVVGECGLTLLSYHCHGLHPAGVSCVGVLLESHVSFHTWPSQGVITLDLFTCGPSSLLPIVPRVEQLFSVPRPWAVDLSDMPEVIWAYKWRGYGLQSKESTAELTDLFTFPIGAMTEYKKEIASIFIGSDRIDIYDVLRSPYQTLESYKRMLKDNKSYEAQHPKVFEPDRIVFTNGVLQSRRSSEAAFYEMLVHPAMFAHDNPKRVAVIGFGDGAILRETLKHKSVEQVFMIDYDYDLLNLTMTHFPEYHDCSFLSGHNKNCLQDPRVITYDGEVENWFLEKSERTNVLFDVIILDEQDYVTKYGEFFDILQNLHRSLAHDGVLVSSMGFAYETDPSVYDTEAASGFLDALASAGFESIRDYEEGHFGFEQPWRFAVAFKALQSKAVWFRNEAMLEIEIQRRIIPAADGSSTLVVFDAAVHRSIMYPSRISEIVYGLRCKSTGKCLESSSGLDPAIPNLSIDENLDVRLLEDTRQHVFAKADISFPSYLGLDAIVASPILVSPISYQISQLFATKYYGWKSKALVSLHDQYLHIVNDHGGPKAIIPSSTHLFINYGCGGNYNIGDTILELSKTGIDLPGSLPETFVGKNGVYNPAADRRSTIVPLAVPLRSINKDEEILKDGNRLDGLSDAWFSHAVAMKQKCSSIKP